MKKALLAAAFALSAFSSASQAAYLYTFNYDALDNYAADSIVFSSASLAINVGDILSYVSGDINGCAPASLALDGSNAFATPIFGNGSCGDGTGPNVDGMFFRPDVMPPLGTGIFVSTETAGRQFESAGGGNFYRYVGGSLVITEDGTVPEPASLQLVGLAILLAGYTAHRRSAR